MMPEPKINQKKTKQKKRSNYMTTALIAEKVPYTRLLSFILASLIICWSLAVISIIQICEILKKIEVPSERMVTLIVEHPDLKPNDKFYFFLSITAVYFMGMVAGLFISKFRHRPISLSATMNGCGILLFSMLTFWNINIFTPLHRKRNLILTSSKAPNSTTRSQNHPTGDYVQQITINIGPISDQFKKELLSFDLRVREELTDNLGWIHETTITNCQLSETINPLYLWVGILLGILYLRKLYPGSRVSRSRY